MPRNTHQHSQERRYYVDACLPAGRDAWSSVDIEDPNPLTLASVLSYQKKASA